MAESNRLEAWRILLLVTGMLIVLAAGVAWILLPVQYEAFALLKVEQTPPTVLEVENPRSDEFAMFKRTQSQLVLSYAVLNGTLRDPAINQLPIVREHQDDSRTWLKDRLMISYPDSAEIMRISFKGTNRDDVLNIVDKVVEVYLREIVYRDRQVRLENEEKLTRAYEAKAADYQTQLAALDQLQRIHKTSGSETAQLKKTLAMDDLKVLLARRATISDELWQTDLEIELAKTRAEMTKEVRTSQVAIMAASDEPLALPVLLRKRDILQAQITQVERKVASQIKIVEGLESFSEQVAAKQEDIEALRQIKNRLGAELDKARVERLAPDRITAVDKAILEDNDGDALWRGSVLAAVAVSGVALVLLALLFPLPKRRTS